jgi:hypothetical protein
MADEGQGALRLRYVSKRRYEVGIDVRSVRRIKDWSRSEEYEYACFPVQLEILADDDECDRCDQNKRAGCQRHDDWQDTSRRPLNAVK